MDITHLIELKTEIDHIFESGANELRVLEMVSNFIDKRYSLQSNEWRRVEDIKSELALLVDCRNILKQCESTSIGRTNINIKILQIEERICILSKNLPIPPTEL